MIDRSRSEYSIMNILTGFGGYFLNTLLGYICRIVFVQCLNADYLGINGLLTNILSMLSLAELGIGGAIGYALYKPIAEKDNEKIIKRVIGMPGETVAIKKGKIYINDKVIDDEYAYGETSDYNKVTLRDNEYFILGDNRLISKDSRYFGPIKENEIKGKIVFRLFPFTKIGTVQ